MTDIKVLIDQIDAAEKQIYNHFGFQQDWRVLPLDDCTDQFWVLNEGYEVVYSPERLTPETVEDGSNTYANEIRHGIVLRSGDYVAIAVDTHCDGNQFLSIFRADKEQTRAEVYVE